MRGAETRRVDLDGPAIHRLRLSQAAARLVDRREVVQVNRDQVMVGTVGALDDRQRTTIETLGLGVFLLLIEQRGQRRHVRGDVGMLRPKGASSDANGLPRERLAAHPVAGGVLQPTEIVVDGRDFRIVRAQRLLGDRQRALIERAGIRETREVLVADGEVVQGCRNLEMADAEALLESRDRFAEHWLGVVIASLLIEHVAELHETLAKPSRHTSCARRDSPKIGRYAPPASLGPRWPCSNTTRP